MCSITMKQFKAQLEGIFAAKTKPMAIENTNYVFLNQPAAEGSVERYLRSQD